MCAPVHQAVLSDIPTDCHSIGPECIRKRIRIGVLSVNLKLKKRKSKFTNFTY